MVRSLLRLSVLTALGASAALAQATPTVSDSSAPPPRRRFLALPGLGSSPETGWEAAFTVVLTSTSTSDTLARPVVVTAYALRSERAQTRAAVDVERWFDGNRRRLLTSLSAVEYPYSFHGIGDRTTDRDRETYTPQWIEGYLQFDQAIRRGLYLFTAARLGAQRVEPTSPGLLMDQRVPGSRSFRSAILTVGANWDTRDHVIATRSGQLASVAYGQSSPLWGGTYTYSRINAEWRGFRELAPRHVLAAHVTITGADGTVPFDQLSNIGGGNIMRGYWGGRFRDRWVVASQAEYRSPLLRNRLGMVAFGGVGHAAPRLGALSRARPFPSAGAGVRVQVDQVQRTALRVDYAVGAYGFAGLYVGFNQAF